MALSWRLRPLLTISTHAYRSLRPPIGEQIFGEVQLSEGTRALAPAAMTIVANLEFPMAIRTME